MSRKLRFCLGIGEVPHHGHFYFSVQVTVGKRSTDFAVSISCIYVCLVISCVLITSRILVAFCVANAVIITTASILLISPLIECRFVESAEAARCSSVLDNLSTIRSEESP
jgi:hypothetical protein